MSNASGFYNAPITKVLCVAPAIATLMLSGRFAAGTRIDYGGIFLQHGWYRVLAHNLVYEGLGDLLVGTTLMYMLRVYERRVGSAKFASFGFLSVVASSMWQLAAVALVPSLGHVASGPLGLLGALLVQYYLRVPALMPRAVRAFGIDWTDKSLAYIMAAQLCLAHGFHSGAAFAGGLLGGAAWASQVVPCRRLRPGRSVRAFFARHVLPWVSSAPTTAVRAHERALAHERRRALGLEGDEDGWSTTRQAQPVPGMAEAEQAQLQQAMAASMGGAGPAQRSAAPDPAAQMAAAQQLPEPREEDVATLVAMGFARSDAARALRDSLGSVEAAANSLLAAHQ